MKRIILGLVMLVALMATAGDAMASKLVTERLRWRSQNSSNVNTVRDTLYTVLAVGETDTSSTFSTSGWATPVAAVGDSVPIGWIVIAQDSSAAGTVAATSYTVNVDIGGGAETGFTSTGVVTLTDPMAGDKTVRIPLYVNFGSARGVPGTIGHIAPAVRLRVAPMLPISVGKNPLLSASKRDVGNWFPGTCFAEIYMKSSSYGGSLVQGCIEQTSREIKAQTGVQLSASDFRDPEVLSHFQGVYGASNPWRS